MKAPHKKAGSPVARGAIGIVSLCAFVAIIVAVVALRPRTLQDGTPDDRLLAAMQQVVWDAQRVLDEVGDVPGSLDDLMRMAYPDQGKVPDQNIFYQRIQTPSIRLCGKFNTSSSDPTKAWPYFDVSVVLQSELTRPHPSGRHCYDVTLNATAPATREDALLFRDMDATATTAECIFNATGVLPVTIPDVGVAREFEHDNPACRVRKFIARSQQVLAYTATSATSIRLCAVFNNGYSPADKPARVFDPAQDARFDELTRPRPLSGQYCYGIKMLLPDPKADAPSSTWDEPIDVEKLPEAIRGAAKQDKRAIDVVVNVLRLARCAFTIGGSAPATIKEAIQTVASRPGLADRYKCGWVPSYYSEPTNYASVTYERIDRAQLRVCAKFQAAWDHPLALNFYREALSEWPTRLPELQRPISQPGQSCYSVRLTAIGSGAV